MSPRPNNNKKPNDPQLLAVGNVRFLITWPQISIYDRSYLTASLLF